MKVRIFNPLPPGVQMAPDALDGNVGKEITMRGPHGQAHPATVVAVHVLDDGYELELDVPDWELVIGAEAS